MTELPAKKDVSLALLEQSSVFVHLDPRRDGVVVPPWLRKQPRLTLQVGLNMAIAIPDLYVDEQGMSCTLSFNRSPFHCHVPWTAVFAMVGEDGRGMLWPEDVPPELAQQPASGGGAAAAATPPKEERKLRAVPAPPPSAPDVAAAPTGDAAPAEAPVAAPSSEGTDAAPKRAAAKKPRAKKAEAADPNAPPKEPKPKAPRAKAAPKDGAAKPARTRKKPLGEDASLADAAPAPKPAAASSPAPASEPAAPPPAPRPPVPVSPPAAAAPPPRAPGAAPRVGTSPGKPKRELPPYLRVVK